MKKSLRKIKFNRTLYKQLLFTVFAFIIMVVSSYAFMSSIVNGSLVRNADSVLDFAEERVSSALLESRLTLERFSETVRSMIMRGAAVGTINAHIQNMSETDLLSGKAEHVVKGFYGYFETLPGGPVFLHSNAWLPRGGQNSGQSRWYYEAIAANGEIVESSPYYAGEANGTVVSYAKCIFDNRGRRLGVICFDLQIDSIGRAVVNTALNQGGYGMLLDNNMMVLAHPNTDFIRKSIRSPDIPLRVFADNLLKDGKLIERSMQSFKGEESIVFFRKIFNGWYLGLVTPEAQYYKSMSKMALIFGLLGATLAAALCVILVRLDAARAKSDEESRQKSMFLANMSHEIRTPINAIVGMTAIGRTALNSERKDYCFSKISDASKHLLGVINDILDISKIEANKIELSSTEFIFERMLQQVVNVINFRLDEKKQKLAVHIDKDIPRTLVGDDQRLAQVITNLLGNAVKFAPENSSINLKTYFLGETDGVCAIKVEVTDAGIGISPEQLDRLFRPFQQAESSTSRRYGGTGLGLAISKSIVEMMGGKIWVESELGQGSTFAFIVNMRRGADAQTALGYQSINWSNIRILAVDDDPDILVYFKEIVSNFGARCEVAASAEEALRLFNERGAYNMYFLDLRMPYMDGIDLAREIRCREQKSGHAVIIMISSADLSEVETEAKTAGVDKFLLKPLFPSAIADVISECIGIVNENTDEIPADIRGIFAEHCILFAEDVDINREIVLALLEPTGVRIDCAENGLEAVKMFSEAPEKYAMIFMDVQMPEMDGYEASRKIRALDLPRAGSVPIVAMTAHVFKEDIERCLAAGMSDHLGKPLDINILLETMLRYLGTRPLAI